MSRLAVGLFALCVAGCGEEPNHDSFEPIIVGSSYDAFVAASEKALGLGPAASDLYFVVKVQLVDSYGRETLAPVVTLTWAAEDLKMVNWKGFSRYQMANLAQVQINGPRGVMAFAEWCEKWRALTPRLCGTQREKSENQWAMTV